MRILYLHQHYSGPLGSTATRSHAMARALAARGHAVTMACGQYRGAATGLTGGFREGRREGRSAGIRIVEYAIPCGNADGLGGRALAFLRFAGRATPLALGEAWDLVIASSTPLTVVLPALAARRWRGVPFVFEIRDPWPELPLAMGGGGLAGRRLLGALGPLADAACRQAAAVIALSDGMGATARARGAAAERVVVVPNGCDLDLFGPHITPWRPAEAGSDEVVAVYAGAQGRANGLHQVLDAAGWLRDAGEHRLRLLLVGQGSETEALRARVAREGLGNVSFLPPLPKRRLAGLLAGSQIGLQCLAPVPEFAEWTAPNKLMDYLAAGLPVVANMAGQAARILDGGAGAGPCGLATPPGDAAALGAALATLARDPTQRARFGATARQQAVRRWDRRLQTERFCAIVEGAVGPARPVAVAA